MVYNKSKDAKEKSKINVIKLDNPIIAFLAKYCVERAIEDKKRIFKILEGGKGKSLLADGGGNGKNRQP